MSSLTFAAFLVILVVVTPFVELKVVVLAANPHEITKHEGQQQQQQQLRHQQQQQDVPNIVHRSLNFHSDVGTENEFEYSSQKEATSGTSSSSIQPQRRVMSVGGFQLDDPQQGFAMSACGFIEEQFQSDTVVCTCSSSSLLYTTTGSSSVKYGCEQTQIVCRNNDEQVDKTEYDTDNNDDYYSDVCARSVYTGTVSVDGPIMSSNFCLQNLAIDGERMMRHGDLCLAVEHKHRKEGALGIHKCRASIGLQKCHCDVCNNGLGIRLDCSNTDQTMVSAQCDAIRLVTTIVNDRHSIPTFFPSFGKKR